MHTRPIKRSENNHLGNLEVLLKELSDLGGTRLYCEVNNRQIYRYLYQLNELEYEMLKNINQDSDSHTGYSVRIVEQAQNPDSPHFNIIHSGRLFIIELIRQLRMGKMKIAMPLLMLIFNYNHEDAITISHQTTVLGVQ